MRSDRLQLVEQHGLPEDVLAGRQSQRRKRAEVILSNTTDGGPGIRLRRPLVAPVGVVGALCVVAAARPSTAAVALGGLAVIGHAAVP